MSTADAVVEEAEANVRALVGALRQRDNEAISYMLVTMTRDELEQALVHASYLLAFRDVVIIKERFREEDR